MFRIYITKLEDKNKKNVNGEWIDLPIDNVENTVKQLDSRYGNWIIKSYQNSEIAIHIENYQTYSKYHNLNSINWIAIHYNALSNTDKRLLKQLSKEGKEVDETLNQIIETRVRMIAIDSLKTMMPTEQFEKFVKRFDSEYLL